MADLDTVMSVVRNELERALRRYPSMRSRHEGYAILLEELDEAWDAIKRNDGPAATWEMVQVAAMAVRWLLDVGEGLEGLE